MWSDGEIVKAGGRCALKGSLAISSPVDLGGVVNGNGYRS